MSLICLQVVPQLFMLDVLGITFTMRCRKLKDDVIRQQKKGFALTVISKKLAFEGVKTAEAILFLVLST